MNRTPALIVVGIAAFLIAASLVLSLPNDSFTKADYLAYVGQEITATQAFTEYRICNPAIADFYVASKTKDYFNWYFDEASGKLNNYWFEIKVKENYTIEAAGYKETCAPYVEKNGTAVKNCTYIATPYKTTAWRDVWQKFNPIGATFKAGTCYNVRIYGTYDIPYKEPLAVDNVLQIAGYDFKQYAWWNATLPYRYLIRTNSTIANMPFVVNDTDLVAKSFAIWTNNATTADENIYLYCENSGCLTGLISIGNETDGVSWATENASYSGYNQTGVFEGAGGVWFLESNTNDIDMSGNGNTLVGLETVALTTGLFGNGTTGNTMADYMTCPDSPSLSNNGANDEITIEIWFKKVGADTIGLVGKDEEVAGKREWEIHTDGESVAFQVFDGNALTGSCTFTPTSSLDGDGIFHYFVAQAKENNYQTVWLDGVNVTCPDVSSTLGDGIANVSIGSETFYAPQGDIMDSVKIWKSIKTPEYIREQYYLKTGNLSTLGAEETNGGSAAITLTVVSPTNATTGNTTVSITGSTDIKGNVTYSVDAVANQTACRLCTAFSNTTGTLADGGHNIHVYAANASTSQDDELVYFTVDTTPPSISIQKPENITYFTKVIPLNFTASDAHSSVSACWYNFNGTNISLSSCGNSTFNVSTIGAKSVRVYANDTYNLQSYADSYFFVNTPAYAYARDNVSGGLLSTFNIFVYEGTTLLRNMATANGTMPFYVLDFLDKNLTFNVHATDYQNANYSENFTASILTFNKTYDLQPAGLLVKTYNEEDIATQLTFNATLLNDTYSYTWYNQTTFRGNSSNFTGDTTVSINSNGYLQRSYYVTLTQNDLTILNAYLLPISDGWLVRFHIRDVYENALDNALCTAKRFLNNTWQTVGEQETDVAGTCAMFLNPLVTYQITVHLTGYADASVILQPNSQDYKIYLSSSTTTVFSTVLTNMTMSLVPSSTSLNQSVELFICTVTAAGNDLTYYGLNITNATGTVFAKTNTTNMAGGNISVLVNCANQKNLTVNCFFKRPSFEEYDIQRNYTVYNQTTGASLQNALTGLSNMGLTKLTLGFISIIITGLGAGFFSTRNIYAGVIAGLIILAIFTFVLNWFDWLIYMLITLTIGSLMLLRSRI